MINCSADQAHTASKVSKPQDSTFTAGILP